MLVRHVVPDGGLRRGHRHHSVAVSAAAEAGRWVVTEGADPTAGAQFNGVSCVAADDCVAVGDEVVGGRQQALAEHWNGKRWAPQDLPPSAMSSA